MKSHAGGQKHDAKTKEFGLTLFISGILEETLLESFKRRSVITGVTQTLPQEQVQAVSTIMEKKQPQAQGRGPIVIV